MGSQGKNYCQAYNEILASTLGAVQLMVVGTYLLHSLSLCSTYTFQRSVQCADCKTSGTRVPSKLLCMALRCQESKRVLFCREEIDWMSLRSSDCPEDMVMNLLTVLRYLKGLWDQKVGRRGWESYSKAQIQNICGHNEEALACIRRNWGLKSF